MAVLAVGVWVGALVPPVVAVGLASAAAFAGLPRDRRRTLMLCLGVVAGACVAGLATQRSTATQEARVPEGRVTVRAVATGDPVLDFGASVLIQPVALASDSGWKGWRAPLLLLHGAPEGLMAGEVVEFTGTIERGRITFRGRAIAGVVSSSQVVRVGSASNPLLALGNALRRRVLGGLDSVSGLPAGALLTGFLIGDVSRLPDSDTEALRRAGLSHYVAVSGSNVALFLGAWWIAVGPLGVGPRTRAMLGILGVAVFAVVTRWEPSVIRASVMASLVLVGRAVGRPITPFTALGGAVALSLLVAPDLAGSVGFSLSVAATLGIMIGSAMWADRRPRWVWAPLGATVAAQLAVAPLLLVWFGSVPLLAPATNLLAAPLVALSTAIGGVGAILHIAPLVAVGVAIAQWVLVIAQTAVDLPQLGLGAIAAGAFGVVGAVRFPFVRPLLVLAVPIMLGLTVVPVAGPVAPVMHFLDVGQGDATLIQGGGATILIDGGPDPALLRSHLVREGVRRIDLLIVTHRHADHTTGLVGLTGVVSVGLVWYPDQLAAADSPLDDLILEWRAARSVSEIPEVGDTVRIGELVVSVLAPLRRYASPNDGSIVLMIEARGTTVLMSGDIETFAQDDLGPIRADVLKVPHQGAATSDLDWLTASAPAVAVISVGDNTYGHPAPEVIATLERAGSLVLRTDRDGTVTLRFDEVAGIALPSVP